MHRVLEQLGAPHAGPEPFADALELEQQHEVELPVAQPRRDLLRLTLGQGEGDEWMGGAKVGDRHRDQGRAGGGEGRDPQMAAADTGDRGDLRLGDLEAGEDRVGVADQHLTGGCRTHTAAIALDQGHPRFRLQPRNGLGDRRL